MTPALEFIVWKDHHEPEGKTWMDPTPPDKLEPMVIQSIGFVTSENDEILELARDYARDPDTSQPAGGTINLLKCAIVSRNIILRPLERA